MALLTVSPYYSNSSLETIVIELLHVHGDKINSRYFPVIILFYVERYYKLLIFQKIGLKFLFAMAYSVK